MHTKRSLSHGLRWFALCVILALLVSPLSLLDARPAAAHTPVTYQAASLVLGQVDFSSKLYGAGPANLRWPGDVAVDPVTGKVFVLDPNNNRVLRFAGQGALVNGAAAEAVLGQANFTDTAGAGGANHFNTPESICLDAQGRLWVVDGLNNRVLRFDNASAKASGASANGVLGQPDFTTYADALNQSGFDHPLSAYVDVFGNLYVGESLNYRILRFNNAAGKANGAPADGVLGQPNFITNNLPPADPTAGTVYQPQGMTGDAYGKLWVADTHYNRVLFFNNAAGKANGANADGVLGQPDLTTDTYNWTQNSFYNPVSLALDGQGRLWVSDSLNHRVLYFNDAAHASGQVNASGVLGQLNYTNHTANAGLANPAAQTMQSPAGLWYDPGSDLLWLADSGNHRVLAYGDVNLVVTGASGVRVVPGAATGTAANGSYFGALDLGSSFERTFTIQNRSFQTLNLTGGLAPIWTAGPNNSDFAVIAQPTTTSLAPWASTSFTIRFTPSAAGARTAQIQIPSTDDDYDPRFTFPVRGESGPYVSTVYHPADLVLGQPGFQTSAKGTSAAAMETPAAIAVDPGSGKVFVADSGNHRVLRFAGGGALANGAAAEAVLGQADFTTANEAVTRSGMGFPLGLAVDRLGRLWVADSNNDRVLRFDNAATLGNGAPADGVLGQADFTSEVGAGGADRMSSPDNLYIDSQGRLWVADTANSRVLRFDNPAAKPNGAPADGVLGQADFTGVTNGLAQNRLDHPTGLTGDGAGRLWVVDSANHRVLRFDNAAALPNGSNASLVLGQATFDSETRGNSGSQMDAPKGITLDISQRLWVSDMGNSRVLRFDGASTLENGAFSNGALGQAEVYSSVEDLGGLSALSLDHPAGIFYDRDHDSLWIADLANNRVLAHIDPYMGVWGLQRISSGDYTPSPVKGTHFGLRLLGKPAELSFTIRNDGLQGLKLSGAPAVSLQGAAAGDFSVVAQPTTNLAAGGTTSFTLRFTPSALGAREAVVHIASNDTLTPDYTFHIVGLGTDRYWLYLPVAQR